MFHIRAFMDGMTRPSTKSIDGNSKVTGNAGRAHAKKRIRRKDPHQYKVTDTCSNKIRYEQGEKKKETARNRERTRLGKIMGDASNEES